MGRWGSDCSAEAAGPASQHFAQKSILALVTMHKSYVIKGKPSMPSLVLILTHIILSAHPMG